MIAGVLFCGILALLSCSCVSDVYDDGGSDGELVTLVLKAAVLDSGEQDDQAGEDLMNSLRIVILSRNRNGYWSVEHNVNENFNSGVRISDEKPFKVAKNQTKRIYLVANASMVRRLDGSVIDLGADELYIPDRSGVAAIDTVDFFLLGKDMPQEGLPMSSMYEFEMGKTSKTMVCHVVRAAAKITFRYVNRTTQIPENPGDGQVFARRRRIRLLGWTLENVADRSYVMPRVNAGADGRYAVVDSRLGQLRVLDGDWMDWMLQETGKGDDVSRYEWLTDYELPSKAVHSVYTHWYDNSPGAPDAPVIFPEESAGAENAAYASEAVYLPESGNRQWYDKDNQPDASLKLQSYRVTVITNELDESLEDVPGNWVAASYTAVMPQLFSMFRNTHVKVNVTFVGAGQFALYAEIAPWKELKPVEGELIPDTPRPAGH